ncbi:unnamed protein product [Auanema sp. JU1783]|nr:unnamed protein product [Auanema sp. JU1783]
MVSKSSRELAYRSSEKGESTIVTTEELLKHVGLCNPFTQFITISMAFLWMLSALAAVSPAFMSPTMPCEKNCTFVTVQQEFGLEKSLIDPGEMTSSIYFVGNLVFGQIFCVASDRIGRRPVLIFSLIISGLAGTGAAFAPNFYLMLLGRMIQGSFFSALTMINWVLCGESIAFHGHGAASFLFGLLWVIGYCLVAPLALIVPDWRYIQFIISIPSVLFGILMFFTLPESFSFLIAKERKTDAHKWISKASMFTRQEYNYDLDKIIAHDASNVTQESSLGECLRNILKRFDLKLYVFIQSMLWITDFMLYASFSLSSTSISKDTNPYLLYIFSGIVELPCYLLIPFGLELLGRKPTVMLSHIITAASLIVCVLFPADDHATVFLFAWLIGKFGTASAFMCCFVYGAECFPVQYRNICLGFCATVANVGAMIATHMEILDTVYPGLQFMFYTVLCLIATLITVFLPETKNHGTEETTVAADERF